MISLWLGVVHYVNLIFELSNWLLLGAGIAVLAAVARGWLGLIGVAAFGAAAMFVVSVGGWLGDDSDKIARLQAEKARLEAKTEELRLTGEALANLNKRLGEAAQHNEQVMIDLETALKEQADNPECDVPEDVLDALRSIK